MLNDPGKVGNDSITQQVATVLWRIAPEKVGKPLVVEDATPLVAHGVTTQALKLVFRGKRYTLIPPGRPVPAVVQLFSSSPRPGLTLYRGASGSEDSDHFLGHFEVLGLAPPGNVNVSTKFVVAEGQIILCALDNNRDMFRDNNRDMFLEIRRMETEPAD